MVRRDFIRYSAISLGALKASQLLPYVSINELKKSLKNKNNYILPERLKKNSTIAITSPGSPSSMYEIRKSVRFFKSMGYKVLIGDTVKKQQNRYRYLSASDNERVDEFMNYILNPDVNAVISARGGYGTMRIIDDIDYNQIRNNPKIIIGFSDITALLHAIYNKSKLITYHGPVASSSFNLFTQNIFNNVLKENKISEFKIDNYITINPGYFSGKIIAGNLTILTALLGTDYEIDTAGKILFIEEISEHSYEIDRMLNQLLLSDKLDKVSGIIFGKFKNLNSRKPFFPNKGFTIKEVINQLIKPTGIPCIIGFPFGHTENNFTLPIGINAEFNTENGIFKFLEKTIND